MVGRHSSDRSGLRMPIAQTIYLQCKTKKGYRLPYKLKWFECSVIKCLYYLTVPNNSIVHLYLYSYRAIRLSGIQLNVICINNRFLVWLVYILIYYTNIFGAVWRQLLSHHQFQIVGILKQPWTDTCILIPPIREISDYRERYLMFFGLRNLFGWCTNNELVYSI